MSFAARIASLEINDQTPILLESYREVARPSIKVMDPMKCTIPKIALYCFNLREEWVRRYVERHPRLVDARDTEGNGLLMWTFWALRNVRLQAAGELSSRVLKLAEFLLDRGADPRWTARDGYHFTHFLCSMGAEEALQFVERRGVAAWDATAHWEALPLDYLLMSGHLELFERYRHRGQYSQHALHLVAYTSSSARNVEFALRLPLVRGRIDDLYTDPRRGGRWTALMCAVRAKRLYNARALLSAGARPDVTAPCGTTALELLIRYAPKTEEAMHLLRDLIAASADPNQPLCTRELPVEWVVRHRRLQYLEVMLAIEGPRQTRLTVSAEGKPPLTTLALQAAHFHALDVLLLEIAGRAALCPAPRSALAAALRLGIPDCTRALLARNQDWTRLDHLFEMTIHANWLDGFEWLWNAAPAADLHRCDWTAPLAAALRADHPGFATNILGAAPALAFRCPALVNALEEGRRTALRVAFKHSRDICWTYVTTELRARNATATLTCLRPYM